MYWKWFTIPVWWQKALFFVSLVLRLCLLSAFTQLTSVLTVLSCTQTLSSSSTPPHFSRQCLSFFFFSFILPPLSFFTPLSVSTGASTQPSPLFSLEFLCGECVLGKVESGGGGLVAMCLCAAQHINLLSNSGRQACACYKMCLCNLKV